MKNPKLKYIPNQNQTVFPLDSNITVLETGKYDFKSAETTEHSFMLYSNTAAEKCYCVTRKELLATVKQVDHSDHYLDGRKFIIQSNPTASQYLLRVQSSEGQSAHCLHEIKWSYFIFQYFNGKNYENVDILLKTLRLCTLCSWSFHPQTQILPLGLWMTYFLCTNEKAVSIAIYKTDDTIMR